MNLKRYVGLWTLLIFVTSCTKDEIKPSCTLEGYDFEAKGWTRTDESTDIACAFYLEAFSWQDKIYLAPGSHCADVGFMPFLSCNGEFICEQPASRACNRFLREKVDLGIVAYRAE